MTSYPDRVKGYYEETFWDYIDQQELRLQQCADCGEWRFPAGPVCPACLSDEFAWEAVSGEGEIISYVVFRKQYFDAYEPPYNVASIELAEGPLFMSNIIGISIDELDIGQDVSLVFEAVTEDLTLPRFELA